MNKDSYGGIISLVAFIAAAVFFGVLVFGGSISDWPLEVAGFFSLSVGFVLQRLGL